jgi:restriction system protein
MDDQTGVYRITPRGQKLIAENPERVDVRVLSQFPELVAFRKRSVGKRRKGWGSRRGGFTRRRQVSNRADAEARADHEAELALGIRNRIYACDPTFFEKLVLKILVAMGYGGSEEEAAEHLGGSGDEGVDGGIHEDPRTVTTEQISGIMCAALNR